MKSVEETLVQWRKQEFQEAMSMMQTALHIASEKTDIVKQRECANFFQISVNTLKDWVRRGAPEIRLDSGMPLYSKKAITEWLLQHQK